MQLQLSDYQENINVIICEIIAPLFKDTVCIINTYCRFNSGFPTLWDTQPKSADFRAVVVGNGHNVKPVVKYQICQ